MSRQSMIYGMKFQFELKNKKDLGRPFLNVLLLMNVPKIWAAKVQWRKLHLPWAWQLIGESAHPLRSTLGPTLF